MIASFTYLLAYLSVLSILCHLQFKANDSSCWCDKAIQVKVWAVTVVLLTAHDHWSAL